MKYWGMLIWLLEFPPAQQVAVCRNFKVSSTTAVDWFSFAREVYLDDCLNNSEKIGGHQKVVEIDEAKFGKSKYNRGRYIEGQWVFGGVKRGSRKAFYIPVATRDVDTLLQSLRSGSSPTPSL